MLPLLEQGALLTLGDGDMAEGDWEQMWRRELGKDDEEKTGLTFIACVPEHGMWPV